MSAATSPPTSRAWAFAERFARFISGLREAMATAAGHHPVLLGIAALLWNRLTEAAERFAAIAAHPVARSRRRPAEPAPQPVDMVPADMVPADRVPADGVSADAAPTDATPADATLVDATVADATLADAAPAKAAPARPRAPRRILPRTNGWLARMAPETVPFGVELIHLLAQPEMAELLATAPRLWRVLRPLCRMFAITPPETLPPPPDTPKRRAPKPDAHRSRRRSEAAATRRFGPLGYRPPIFCR